MRTAEEMYDYTVRNKFGTGITKRATKKHFDVVENQLHDDERALIAFVGLHEQEGTDLQGNFAYVITNKRLIMGQKGILSRSKTKTVLLEHLNDVTVKNGIVWRDIEIDTIKDHFVVKNNTNASEKLGNKVQETIFSLKKLVDIPTKETSQSNPVEEIKGYKQLLDEGIITEEEFEQKKKQLLNI